MTRFRSGWAVRWWLGRRLLRRPGQPVALVAITGCSMVTGLVLLALLATPGVLAAQRDADAALAVTQGGKRTGLYAYQSFLDWRDEFSVRVVHVARTPSAKLPELPGTSRFPGPGEAWLSPQLRRDIARDPVLGKAFPQRIVGEIDAAVLPTTATRLAYLGEDVATAERHRGRPVQRIGGPYPDVLPTSAALVALAVSAVVLLVGVPLFALLVAAFGLVSQPRAAQVRLLAALGTAPGAARALAGADAAVAGVLGSLLACVCFPLLGRIVTSVPGLPAHWNTGQPRLTLAGVALALAVPLVAAWLSVRRAGTGPSRAAGLRRPRRGPGRITLLLYVAALLGVLLTSGVKADSSTTTVAIVTAAVAGLVVLTPRAVRVVARVAGARLARRRSPGAADIVAAARLTRLEPSAARSISLVSATVVLAVCVSPLVAQVAPRDTLTAALNERSGRVVVVMSPVPAADVLDDLRRLPGVIALATPTKDGDTVRYDLSCDQAKLLLLRQRCAPGSRASVLDLGPEQSAAWPGVSGDWTIAEIGPGQDSRPAAGRRGGGPVIGMVRDPDAFWRLAATARGLNPRTSVEANVGGLIGGSDQIYLRMQEWLRAGLLLLLLTMGAVILLAAAHDARDRAGLRWALHAVGAGRAPFLAALRRELLIRNLALLGVTALAAGVAAYAATGWVTADPIPAGWLALIYGSLLTLTALTTLVPLLVGALLRPHRSTDGSSAITQRPL